MGRNTANDIPSGIHISSKHPEGSDMIEMKKAKDLTKEEFDRSKAIVESGGEPFPATVEDLSTRTDSVLLVKDEDGSLIGFAALKVPSAERIGKLFSKLRSTYDPSDFRLELGWVHVDEGKADEGTKDEIVTAITDRVGGKVFSLIYAEDDGMRAALKGCGYYKSGVDVPTAKGDRHFSLYVKE